MLRIGIIGVFDPQRAYHTASNDSLEQAATSLAPFFRLLVAFWSDINKIVVS